MNNSVTTIEIDRNVVSYAVLKEMLRQKIDQKNPRGSKAKGWFGTANNKIVSIECHKENPCCMVNISTSFSDLIFKAKYTLSSAMIAQGTLSQNFFLCPEKVEFKAITHNKQPYFFKFKSTNHNLDYVNHIITQNIVSIHDMIAAQFIGKPLPKTILITKISGDKKGHLSGHIDPVGLPSAWNQTPTAKKDGHKAIYNKNEILFVEHDSQKISPVSYHFGDTKKGEIRLMMVTSDKDLASIDPEKLSSYDMKILSFTRSKPETMLTKMPK